MKKLILLLLVIITSCSEQNNIKPEYPVISTINNDIGTSVLIKLYIIDSCEYIGNITTHHNKYFLAHKGNCKQCLKHNPYKNL